MVMTAKLREIHSELEFHTEKPEFVSFHGTAVPSPAYIAAETKLILYERTLRPIEEPIEDQDIAQALIKQAVDDILSLDESIRINDQDDLDELTEAAIDSLHWIASDGPGARSRLSFEECCILCGCLDHYVIREQIKRNLRLSLATIERLVLACA